MMYNYNAKDCEQCSPDSVCCYCKNLACCELEEQLKTKEQECEEWKENCDNLIKVQYELADNNKRLRQALTEIKEIAEPRIVHGLTDMEYVNIYSKTMEQILQICDEVISE